MSISSYAIKNIRRDLKDAMEEGDILATRGFAALLTHEVRRAAKIEAGRQARLSKKEIYESLGMKRVRGAMGGEYFE